MLNVRRKNYANMMLNTNNALEYQQEDYSLIDSGNLEKRKQRFLNMSLQEEEIVKKLRKMIKRQSISPSRLIIVQSKLNNSSID